jgi:putative FmdB family regulatory protein
VPVYDYVCSACRHRTEVIHGINEVGPRFCPACGAEGTMRKGFSTPSIVFKGSGWAKKDRATSARRSASARASASDGTPASSSDSGSDAGSSDGVVASNGPEATRTKGDGASGGPGKRSDRSERTKPASTSSKAAGGD